MRLYFSLFLILILPALAACGSADVTPTRLPTRTPTPVSTALPSVATAVAPGLPDNPLQMFIVPVDGEAAAANETALEETLLNTTGVTLDVVLYENYADALAEFCTASDESAVVWLDGFSYRAAIDLSCGDPALFIEREVDDDNRSGESTQLVFSGSLGNTQISNLNGRVFCRLGFDDFHSWLMPTLILAQNNVSTDDLESVVDYEDVDTLLEALVAGECAATGLSDVEVAERITDNEELAQAVNIGEPTAPIPYAVMLYPIEVQLGARISLTEGLIDLADDEEFTELMRPFLGQDDIERFETSDFSDFNTYIDELGLDFSQLGN